jgi:myo-inositol-1(or 4)-monophosphatase
VIAHALSDDLDLLIAAARRAGEAARPYFREGVETSAKVSYKEGNSPVSEADHAANDALEQHLRRARPTYQWISEETPDSVERLAASHVFVVDPIDGTRAFIAGKPQWTVSVGLVIDGVPVAGVIHAPCLETTYSAAQGQGAFCNGQRVRVSDRTALARAIASGPKPVLEQLERAAGMTLEHGPKIPSLALRLAMVGAGTIDLGIASTGAHEWDVAAADIILREAGGTLVDLDQKTLVYNQESLRRGVLCAGKPELALAAAALLGLRR